MWHVLCPRVVPLGVTLSFSSSQTPPGMSPSAGAYLQMAVSFNYRCLALFTDTGYIWMGLATLKVRSPSCGWVLGAACPCSVLPRCLSQPDLRRPGQESQQLPSGHRWAQLCWLSLLLLISICTPAIGICPLFCFFT